ncbi:MAG TPA: hypothetical protein VGG88_06110 [Gaiellaceae bacterium]
MCRPRMLAPAAIGAALIAASSAGAAEHGGSVTVPTPAMGKTAIRTLTVKSAGPVSVRVTNRAKLGKGFGGVAAVVGPKSGSGTYSVILVMFMGNRSTAPAKNVDLQLSPKGAEVTASKDETHDCGRLKFLNGTFENGPDVKAGPVQAHLSTLLPNAADTSEAESFLDSIISFAWGSCPGQPESPDSGGH